MSSITPIDEIVEHFEVTPDEILKGYRHEIDRLELHLRSANQSIAELMRQKCKRCEEREPLIGKMRRDKVHQPFLSATSTSTRKKRQTS